MVGATCCNPARDRLEELIALAQTYRGWTQKQLAEALGRDPANLVPASGLPKIDLVMRLAEVLDWPVQDVMEDVLGETWERRIQPLADGDRRTGSTGSDTASSADGRALRDAARDAHIEGRYEEAAVLARQAYEVAATPLERAVSAYRELGAWDGLGRYTNSLDACRRGLNEQDAPLAWRFALRAALANAYLALGQHVEAESVATSVVEAMSVRVPDDVVARTGLAMAWFVRGQALREQMDVTERPEAESMAGTAAESLVTAAEHYDRLADELGQDYAGMANTARGALLEVEAFRRQRPSREALQSILDGLDEVTEVETQLGAIMLESYGWWCIFGCNMVLRHVRDPECAQRYMAVFTNKADEIAQRLGNWALRERVFTMEYLRRRRADEDGATAMDDWVIDREDVRVIAGTMGRFPGFRDTAWKILRSARLA